MSETLAERLRQITADDNDEADVLFDAADLIEELQDEVERLRRVIYDLLDDGDETDRAVALAALGEEKKR